VTAGRPCSSDQTSTTFTTTNTLITSSVENAKVDGNRIYFPAGNGAGSNAVGVGRIDVVALTSCGFSELGTSVIPNGGSEPWIGGGTVVGSKFYALGGAAEIYCFDLSADAACGAPYPLVGVADPGSGTVGINQFILESFGGTRLFGNVARPGGLRDLLCVDTATNATCPGFPRVAYTPSSNVDHYNMVLAPILDAAGTAIGICGESGTATTHPFSCFDFAGTPVATPFASTAATYTCWDFATATPCAGFVPSSTGVSTQPYTLRQDPQNPDCIWEEGNQDRFEVFSATLGGTSCTESNAKLEVAPALSYCDGRPGHVSAWDKLLISGVAPADFTAMSVSITDDNGQLVPTGPRVFPSTTTSIDISSISVAGANGHLHFAVVFQDLALAKTATIEATFTGDPAQLCFQTRVGAAQCTGTAPISNQATVATTVPGGVTDAPTGNTSGVATFQVANNTALCPVIPPVVRT
jgi:hypothetical protein